VTGGEGGNVQVVKVSKGTSHVRQGYDEVYSVLSVCGMITLDQETHPLRPGSVAVIPAVSRTRWKRRSERSWSS